MSSSERGLRQGALSGFDSVIMAIAGNAPAYSIAATTAVLISVVGLASPAALLYSAIPMLGIAWAFNYLGRGDVNAGASYSWVGRALHPALGFLSGWALVVSATIFMVAGSLPAGQLTLSLFNDSLAENTALATTVGAVWFLVMVGLVMAGVTVTAKAQWIMTGIEVVLLLVFAVIGLARLGGDNAGADFSWSWFSLGGFGGLGGFAAGALIAAFYFWGWDVTANLNEETEGRGRRAGLGGLVGVLFVFVLFEVYTILSNMLLTPEQIEEDALGNLGEVIVPGAGGKLLIIAVMLSTIATLETTLIQVSRSLFAWAATTPCRPRSAGCTRPARRRWSPPGSSRSCRWSCSSSRTSSARWPTCSPRRSARSVCRSPSTTASRPWRSCSPTARSCSGRCPTWSSSASGRCSVPSSCSGSSSSRCPSWTARPKPSVSARWLWA